MSGDRIIASAQSMRERLAAFLKETIAIPSYSGKEGEVIRRIKAEMQTLGYDEVRVDPMGNLIGRIGSGGELIAFDGHCDTVGIGDPRSWQRDPFAAECIDGVIYGRGAADQKGGLAAAVYAGKILKELGLPKNTSVLVVASVQEEDLEGLSWQYIIEEDHITPSVVVLTEPTDLKLSLGQRGRMEIEVRVHGISCHGSIPERGDNAIYKIVPIVEEVRELNKRLKPDRLLGTGSIAVTEIRSTAPSLCAVPDSALIHLDRRLAREETMRKALKQVAELPAVLRSAAEVYVPKYTTTTHTGFEYPVEAYFPSWLMDKTHPLVLRASAAHRELFGREAVLGVWQFSTNGVATMGKYAIPTIGYGPGKEEHTHTIDDQVKIDDLVSAAAFYAAFALHQ